MISVRPPARGRLGAEISGLNAARPLAPPEAAALTAAIYEHGVVCLHGQELDVRQFETFGAGLGNPIRHVEEDLRMDGAPGVMSLSNADGRPERQRNGGAFWHTDLVFTDNPASFTMLNAVSVPRLGGETRFADQFTAYDDLSGGMKKRIAGLVVLHCYEGRRDGSFPTVRQPMVRPHPATGRKALYGAAGTCIGVEGMPEDEGKDLLGEVGRHAVSDKYVYTHDYTVCDLVIWDNASTLHCGPRLAEAKSGDEARVMHRCSVRGWPAPAVA